MSQGNETATARTVLYTLLQFSSHVAFIAFLLFYTIELLFPSYVSIHLNQYLFLIYAVGSSLLSLLFASNTDSVKEVHLAASRPAPAFFTMAGVLSILVIILRNWTVVRSLERSTIVSIVLYLVIVFGIVVLVARKDEHEE